MTHRSTADLGSLWAHMSAARWFSGKGRGGRLIALTALSPVITEPSVRHVIATVGYPEGPDEYYQLLLSAASKDDEDVLLVDSEGAWRDATNDPDALLAWARAILSGAVDPTARGAEGHWSIDTYRPVDGSRVRTARRFGGEQSNTSIELDDTLIIKLFRRLEPGENLDIVRHRGLNEAGVTSVATVHAAMHATVGVPGHHVASAEHPTTCPSDITLALTTDLAMVVERLPHPRDGWQYFCDRARGLDDAGDDARLIGAGLAAIHRALADLSTPTTVSGTRIADAMSARLHRACHRVPDLTDLQPALVQIFDPLRAMSVPVQPVHGDFHLGQTLLTDDGWRIIDFEGEPLKTAQERRQPDSRWKDVAGMVRSLSYATSATPDPHSTESQQWYRCARAAFLDGYGAATGRERNILAAYEADKAIYETVYEKLNRPEWIDVPLTALHELIG